VVVLEDMVVEVDRVQEVDMEACRYLIFHKLEVVEVDKDLVVEAVEGEIEVEEAYKY
jgi:hypothetical protein